MWCHRRAVRKGAASLFSAAAALAASVARADGPPVRRAGALIDAWRHLLAAGSVADACDVLSGERQGRAATLRWRVRAGLVALEEG